ncbi:MAG TPA: HAMP domain-containing sensor histidine kinase [Anaerolineales bacterium]|nr:HAMP domain-containing sensor histidine kinase [Anaerolineales bacterium]
MGSLLQQIFELLTTATGTLAYHLVLSFTILGAFQVASHRQNPQKDEVFMRRRMLTGFVCLFALQLVLFLFSALAWQQVLDGGYWLPPVDRAVILLSLVCILWMWIFPLPDFIGDIFTFGLVIVLLIGVVFGFYWWQGQYPNLQYNSSWADFLAHVVALILLCGGCISLIVKKPASWVVGIVMLVLLAMGHIFHLFLPLTGGQYSGAVRAFQLTAFPLLFILAQRMSEKPVTAIHQPVEQESLPGKISDLLWDHDFWLTISRVFTVNEIQELYQQVVEGAARLFDADICLYLNSSNGGQQLELVSGINRHTNQLLSSMLLEVRQLPQISSAFQNGKLIAISPTENASDLQALKDLWGGEIHDDSYLFIPGKGADDRTISAMVLSTPSGKTRGEDQQTIMSGVVTVLVQYIARIKAIAEQEERLKQVTQTSASNRAQLMRTSQESSMSNELRLALEEIANLRLRLAEWEANGDDLGVKDSSGHPFERKLDQIENISQDMVQPLTSLNEYADILLSEQFGVLGEKQQKNLERIKVSAERLNRLVNELLQAVSIASQIEKLSVQEIDLVSLLRKLKEEKTERLTQKESELRLELPQQYIPIFSDRMALKTILDQITDYLIHVTGPNEQLILSVKLEHKEGSPDFVLIQVFSNAKPAQQVDWSQVFSPSRNVVYIPDEDNTQKPKFFKVRSLAETLGGKIWVDSEVGKGTTFSLILPVIQSTQIQRFGELEQDV